MQAGDEATLARFWSKVHKTDTCWLWTGGKRGGPSAIYGVFWLDGRRQGAHRAAYQLFIGPIPRGMLVCHDCPGRDNPLCVNPAHLFLGNYLDNNADRSRKGRSNSLRGEDNPRARLTEASVVTIREAFGAGGVTQDKLAQRYGVPRSLIGMVVRGEVWRHIAGPRSAPFRTRSNSGYRGVSFMPKVGRYQVYITFKGKRIALGWVHDPIEGARRFDAKARELYGDGARPHLNFPD